jgi:glucokinase
VASHDPAAVLAVDIGGTKFEVGIVTSDGSILARARCATPAGADGGTLFRTLAGLIDRVLTDRDPQGPSLVGCGVGSGGPMTAHGATISPINIGGWREFALGEQIAGHTGLPTWVDNDAKALALAEGWLGAARDRADHMAMVVSTGVGGGIVLDGRLLDGAQGNAGHVGHICVVPDGRRCGCGAQGCLEAEASGTAIAAITGAPARDASAEVIARTGTLVGRAAAAVANLLDLDLITVAGSVALGFGEPFFAAAQRELDARSRIEFARGARIIPAQLGADGPLIGAAAVGFRSIDPSRSLGSLA